MAVSVEDDGLVEAVEYGLGLGEGGVDVGAGDLGPRWHSVVADPVPGGDADVGPFLLINVSSKGHAEYGELVLQVVQPHTNALGSFVSQGTDVGVRACFLPTKKLYRDLP